MFSHSIIFVLFCSSCFLEGEENILQPESIWTLKRWHQVKVVSKCLWQRLSHQYMQQRTPSADVGLVVTVQDCHQPVGSSSSCQWPCLIELWSGLGFDKIEVIRCFICIRHEPPWTRSWDLFLGPDSRIKKKSLEISQCRNKITTVVINTKKTSPSHSQFGYWGWAWQLKE